MLTCKVPASIRVLGLLCISIGFVVKSHHMHDAFSFLSADLFSDICVLLCCSFDLLATEVCIILDVHSKSHSISPHRCVVKKQNQSTMIPFEAGNHQKEVCRDVKNSTRVHLGTVRTDASLIN